MKAIKLVLSQAIRKRRESILEETQSKSLFDLIISTETHAEEKPNPKVLAPLFDAYDVSPNQVAIIGDTANDMKTAINAKLGLGIGVLTGIAKREELHEADVIIDSAKDVKQILDQYKMNQIDIEKRGNLNHYTKPKYNFWVQYRLKKKTTLLKYLSCALTFCFILILNAYGKFHLDKHF